MSDKVIFNSKVIDTEFDHFTDNSLLDYLENNNIAVHFHCREGFCGACRCKLSCGKVVYQQEPLAYVRKGEVLLCCCKPDGAIELEFT